MKVFGTYIGNKTEVCFKIGNGFVFDMIEGDKIEVKKSEEEIVKLGEEIGIWEKKGKDLFIIEDNDLIENWDSFWVKVDKNKR